MAADCKSALYEYAGSNPALSTNLMSRQRNVARYKLANRVFSASAPVWVVAKQKRY